PPRALRGHRGRGGRLLSRADSGARRRRDRGPGPQLQCHGRQPAPARPAQGVLPGHGVPRAALAADVDARGRAPAPRGSGGHAPPPADTAPRPPPRARPAPPPPRPTTPPSLPPPRAGAAAAAPPPPPPPPPP